MKNHDILIMKLNTYQDDHDDDDGDKFPPENVTGTGSWPTRSNMIRITILVAYVYKKRA